MNIKQTLSGLVASSVISISLLVSCNSYAAINTTITRLLGLSSSDVVFDAGSSDDLYKPDAGYRQELKDRGGDYIVITHYVDPDDSRADLIFHADGELSNADAPFSLFADVSNHVVNLLLNGSGDFDKHLNIPLEHTMVPIEGHFRGAWMTFIIGREFTLIVQDKTNKTFAAHPLFVGLGSGIDDNGSDMTYVFDYFVKGDASTRPNVPFNDPYISTNKRGNWTIWAPNSHYKKLTDALNVIKNDEGFLDKFEQL